MAWITKLKEARGDNAPTEAHKPWLTQLRDAKEAMLEQSDDPWSPILDNLAGTVTVGGITRIATYKIFQQLGIAPKAQTSDVRRRLAREMVKRGWSAVRCYGTNERAFGTQLRGYARKAAYEGEKLLPPNTTRAGRRPQLLM